MQPFRRIFTLIMASALSLAACSPALVPEQEELAQPASPIGPAPVPTKSESAPADSIFPLPDKPVVYESSLPVTLWDSKTRQHVLKLVDPVSGLAVEGYEPIVLGVNYFHTYSPDRKTLAIVTFKSDISPARPTLHILDLAAWQDSTFELETTGWVSSLAYSSDGNLLAIAQNYRDSNLTVFDLKSRSLVAQSPLEFMASRMKFSASSQSLMLYGPVLVDRFTENERSGGPPVVALLNAKDLSMDWSLRVDDVRDGIYPLDENIKNLHQPGAAIYYFPGLAFSPVQDVLYIVHPDKDELTSIDFAARSIKTVEIHPKLNWFERFLSMTAGVAYAKAAEGTTRSAVISSDGKLLYTVGTRSEFKTLSNNELELVQIPLNFQVIATSDGSEMTSIANKASDLAISPDSKMVLIHSWEEPGPWSQIFDVQSGQFIARVEAAYLLVAYRMDGAPLLVSAVQDGSNQYKMSAYSYENGDLLGAWLVPVYGSWLAIQ